MENDVLKNKMAPWQEKGRWYHGIIDNATGNIDTNFTDKYILDNFETSDTSQVRYLWTTSASIHIIDYVFDLYGTLSSNTTAPKAFRYRTDSTKGVSLGPSVLTSGKCEFWIFAVEK